MDYSIGIVECNMNQMRTGRNGENNLTPPSETINEDSTLETTYLNREI